MEARRGILKDFDQASYTATIQIAGSLSVWLSAVPVARNIPAAEMIPGRQCALLFFDPANPKDAVLVGVYS